MKTKILVLLLLSTFSVFGQVEVTIPGGIQDNNPNTNNVLEEAIVNLNGEGTITITGEITLKDNFSIPEGIELNFFKGNKIVIEVTIYQKGQGRIFLLCSSGKQFFKIQTSWVATHSTSLI